MTTTTPGATSAGTPRSTAAADTLRALADTIDVVGEAPFSIYTLNGTPEVHVDSLQPWLDVTGIPAPIAYTPAGTAMWQHADLTWRPTSPAERGFCLRHVDLSQTQPGV